MTTHFFSTLQRSNSIKKGLAIILASIATCQTSSASNSFIVESQTIYNASNQDDLKLMRDYFRASTWTAPFTNSTWQMLKPLEVYKARFLGLEPSNIARLDPITNKLQYDFSRVWESKALKDCKTYGLIPHIVVGHSPQAAFATSSNEKKYRGISNWAAYEEYAYAYLEAVTIKSNILQADFEVGNEPDINGEAWLLETNLQNSDPRMYDAYIKLYAAWSKAADKLAHTYPELKIRIGGPSITFWDHAFAKFNWAEQFIKDVASQRLRLDFISFHYYGNNQALTGLTEFGKFPSVAAQAAEFRQHLKTYNVKNVPLYLTEWGPSWHTNEKPEGIINGNNVGAAWTARFLLTAVENNIDEGLLLLFRDNSDPKTLADNWGWPALLLADAVTPKALYNVALMFNKLTGHRVKTTPVRQGNIGIIAGADSSKVSILVFNQNWDFQDTKDLAAAEQLELTVDQLPFNTTAAKVTYYVVDETHANSHYLQKTKAKASLKSATLQPIATQDIPLTNGSIKLSSVNLEPSSVTLFEITAANP
ncbi:GH39 family glycosyl hydrolase [Methylomonas sp. HW2-6]|uniref:GH39 family glycosyl hydrolase n=1 Tax=Methylomonas sp. HW2-6 TaxID=3376687 RepID=UPI0040431F72